MDIWELDISFYTDGDFGWNFAPIDMKCDHYRESYSLHIYREINENQTEACVKDEFYSILDFLIDNVHGKDYAVKYVKDSIYDAFCDVGERNYHKELSGNYDGSHIDFKIHGDCENCEYTVLNDHDNEDESEDSADYEYVDGPAHYHGTECIEKMRKLYGDDAVRWFCICNAYKYRFRNGSKPGVTAEQDEEKARWYENYAANMMGEQRYY